MKFHNIELDELKTIIESSNSFKEAILKIGYKSSNGSNNNKLQNYLDEKKISYKHFGASKSRDIQNINKEDLELLCKETFTISEIARKLGFEPKGGL